MPPDLGLLRKPVSVGQPDDFDSRMRVSPDHQKPDQTLPARSKVEAGVDEPPEVELGRQLLIAQAGIVDVGLRLCQLV